MGPSYIFQHDYHRLIINTSNNISIKLLDDMTKCLKSIDWLELVILEVWYLIYNLKNLNKATFLQNLKTLSQINV